MEGNSRWDLAVFAVHAAGLEGGIDPGDGAELALEQVAHGGHTGGTGAHDHSGAGARCHFWGLCVSIGLLGVWKMGENVEMREIERKPFIGVLVK